MSLETGLIGPALGVIRSAYDLFRRDRPSATIVRKADDRISPYAAIRITNTSKSSILVKFQAQDTANSYSLRPGAEVIDILEWVLGATWTLNIDPAQSVDIEIVAPRKRDEVPDHEMIEFSFEWQRAEWTYLLGFGSKKIVVPKRSLDELISGRKARFDQAAR